MKAKIRGDYLKKTIKEKYKTIEKFAWKFDFATSLLHRILRGDCDPRISTLVRLCSYLEIKLDEIITLEDCDG